VTVFRHPRVEVGGVGVFYRRLGRFTEVLRQSHVLAASPE
jgi:hypothetical protein